MFYTYILRSISPPEMTASVVHKRLVLSEVDTLFPESGVLCIPDDSAMQK